MRLENKVALLTGIGQGMGRATARLFAQEGARVALSARGRDRLEETASQITAISNIPPSCFTTSSSRIIYNFPFISINSNTIYRIYIT